MLKPNESGIHGDATAVPSDPQRASVAVEPAEPPAKSVARWLTVLVSLAQSQRLGHCAVMPTVLRQEGFRVMIHPHDHRPPHVHCYKAGGVTIVNLGAAPGDEVIREAVGASEQEQRDALRIVCEHHGNLLIEWRRFHG